MLYHAVLQVQFSAATAEGPGGVGAGAEGEAMVRGLQATRVGVDAKLERSKIQVGVLGGDFGVFWGGFLHGACVARHVMQRLLQAYLREAAGRMAQPGAAAAGWIAAGRGAAVPCALHERLAPCS